MSQDVTVDPSNSPFVVPGPSANYGTVTIQPGGYIEIKDATTVTVNTLVKQTTANAT